MSEEPVEEKGKVYGWIVSGEPLEGTWVEIGSGGGLTLTRDEDLFDECVIGTGLIGGDVDVHVDDVYMSKRHCRVWREVDVDGGISHHIEDLGSTNGTYVNGMKLFQPRRLFKGDQIKIGKTVFTWGY